MRLHTVDGVRKYLTAGERDAFLRAAEQADRQVRTLCMTLAYAGCRLSEALALTADRADLAAGVLVIESLKKRRSGIYRVVPVPPALLDALDLVHGIRELQSHRGKGRRVKLWPWSRMTGWRAVHAVIRLGLPLSLRRSLACTDIIENMMGTIRRVCRNVKRWRNAAMALRWTATQAPTGFCNNREPIHLM
jgi:integrase